MEAQAQLAERLGPMQCTSIACRSTAGPAGLVHLSPLPSSSSSSSCPGLPAPASATLSLSVVVVLYPPHHTLMASPPAASAAAGGPHVVFVYGTLMAEEVVRVLLGRAPPSAPALLPNHRRFSIRGRVYPAILPVQGSRVNGKIFRGVTDGELHVFDMFEDEEYVRKTVEVSLTDTSEKLPAYAYIWGSEGDPDLHGEWDFEEWRKVHLKDYLEMTQEFMEEIGQFESKPQA